MGAVRADGLVRHGPSAQLSVAGTESNVAIGLARLGHQARWVGVLGDDQVGALVRRTLRAEGVDVSAVRTSGAPTGILVSETRVPGRARVDYHRACSAGSELRADAVLGALDPLPQVLHITGVTLALGDAPATAVRAGVRYAAAQDIAVSLDVNHRARLWSRERARAALTELAASLEVVFASEDELALVAPAGDDTDAHAKSLLAVGVTEVVVKLGAAGALVHTAAGTHHEPALAVDAVDPIGAGDAFVAGYLSARLDGLSLQDRLVRGNTVGAFVVGTRGDWEGLPTHAELQMLAGPRGEVLR